MNRKVDAQKKAKLTFSDINYNLVWVLFESGVQVWFFSCCFPTVALKICQGLSQSKFFENVAF